MYNWGELIIHHKINSRKVYDFASRHLPEELLSAGDPFSSDEAYHDWYVHRRIGGVGLLPGRPSDGWLGMWQLKTHQRNSALRRLIEMDKLIEVAVDSLTYPLYLRSEDRPTLEDVLDARPPSPQAAFIAPLDNLIWDRKLIQDLFGFEYRWEVYKPVEKRRWGYYVLPVLYGDRFVARFEPVRDKQNGALVIKNWWWEPGIERSERMDGAMKDAIQRFIAYLGVEQLQVDPQIVAREGLVWAP